MIRIRALKDFQIIIASNKVAYPFYRSKWTDSWFLHISKLKNSNRWNIVWIVWFTEKFKLFKVIVDNNTFLLNVANNFKVNCNFLITFSGWADLSQPWKTSRMPSSKNPTTTSSNRVLPNVAIEFRHENAIVMNKQLSLHLVSLLTCLVTRIQTDINEFFFFLLFFFCLLFKLDNQCNSNSKLILRKFFVFWSSMKFKQHSVSFTYF